MNLGEVLALPCFEHSTVVAGAEGLLRPITWVHVIDNPYPTDWAQRNQLVLTTGYAWPREEEAISSMLHAFAEIGVAGIALAAPQFFEGFPASARAQGDALGLPLIEVPWEVPFAQITEAVHTLLLADQSRLLERLDGLHRSLTQAAAEADSLDDIARTLGTLIGRDVLFVSSAGGVQAEFCGGGSSRDGERPNTRAQAEILVAQLAVENPSCVPPARLVAPPDGNSQHPCGVVCAITLSGECQGYVWVRTGHDDPTLLDHRAAEHAAVVAALHLSRQRELALLETRIRWSFLDALLEGRFEASAQALERAQLLGFDSRGSYRVGLVVLDEAVPLSRGAFLERERLAQRLRDFLNTNDLPALMTVSLNKIAFLVPETFPTDGIWEALKRSDIAMTASPAHVGHEGIRQGFQQVQSLVPFLVAGRWSQYEELVLPRVLRGDEGAQVDFVKSVVDPLKAARNGENLVRTLFTLARCGFQLNTTADALGVHISTLRHRLERIRTISGLDLSDVPTRFRIQLACELSYIRGDGESVSPTTSS